MDKIALPEYEVVSLDHIAPGVRGLRILFVNVFAITAADGKWTLIDAGLPMSSHRIESWVEGLFGKDTRPNSIILTHGHFDHVGALKNLAEKWDAPIYAHPLELPYLTGKMKYPPPDPTVGGGLMAVISPLYPRGSVDVSEHVRALPVDGSVPGLPEWKWLHTPGHAVGHISLFREQDRVLVVGDAFCTTKQESFLAVASQTPELHGPPAYYTPDWDAAKDSVERLAALGPAILAPGHGQPMSGPEVAGQVAELARNFDAIARPEHGRYVHEPVTGE